MVRTWSISMLASALGVLASVYGHDNHVFNQVHHAMRQFGSSLDHNGMGFFRASIPADTELYHGGVENEAVRGLEWLAFEPEHALFFTGWHLPPSGQLFKPPREHGWSDAVQIPLAHPHPRPRGYFHTYRTKHPMNLLYIDGQSAAKTGLGTLDTQDLLLLHNNPPEPPEVNAGDFILAGDLPRALKGEAARAASLCHLAKDHWDDSIDGFIRMEMGFEVILCDFEKHVDVVHIAAPSDCDHPSDNYVFDWCQAAAARYDGIGGGRVRIDFDGFVTMFDFPGLLYFDNDRFPRIDNGSEAVIAEAREAVAKITRQAYNDSSVDWQQISDMIVTRYAPRIEYLALSSWTNLTKYRQEVDGALRPFIPSYHHRNATLEIDRCTHQFIPATVNNSTIPQAIRNVSYRICEAFVSASTSGNVVDAIAIMHRLKHWLGWSEWRRCRGCGPHEICFVPMWPFGAQKFFDRPSCISNMTDVDHDYW